MNKPDTPEKDSALGRRDFMKLGAAGTAAVLAPRGVGRAGCGHKTKRRGLVGCASGQRRSWQTDRDRMPLALVSGSLQQSSRRSRGRPSRITIRSTTISKSAVNGWTSTASDALPDAIRPMPWQ